MKRRWKRGLALLLTLCLLGGNLAFAEELPETVAEPVIKEETVAENEEAPGENAENADVEAEEQEANAPGEDEQALEDSEENMPKPMRSARDTIYLDGKNGVNTNDGSTPENAVKTFGRAKEIATANQNIVKIIVTGTVDISDEITLEGTNAKILRGENFNKYVFKVPSGKTATLKKITIDGNSENNPNIKESLIRAESKSTLNIQDEAVIKNNQIKAIENTATTGGGVHASHATVNMSGGTVEKNQATYGGGIYLYGSTMHFTGGSVQNNRSEQVIDNGVDPKAYYSSGGGICADKGSTIHMSDKAEVKSNFAHEIGGGISLGSNEWGPGNTLYMSGGKIDANTAGASGGGLFIQAKFLQGGISKAYISAGQITNNQMNGQGKTNTAFGGGGIYVNGFPDELCWESNCYNGQNGELYLANAVITNNSATKVFLDGELKKNASDGGGYAACPISKTVIHVTDGVAIYKNNAQIQGKDLYILGKAKYDLHGGIPTYELAERMLGGALWNWKQEDKQLLPLDEYTGELQDNEELALHTDFKGSEWVNRLGTVLIADNTSVTRGGGIGSNGSVFFGTDGETREVTVEKQWEDEGNSGTRPKEIKVQLWARLDGEKQEYQVAEETVTETSGWKITFDNLPTVYHTDFNVENGSFAPSDVGKKIIYSVKEISVPGYESEVTGNAKDGFTITNKRKPEKPPTPSEKFIEIPVEKIWQDDGHEEKRPTEITVTLYADGVATEKTLVLSAANGWKGVFRNLPEKKDGKVITYTVKEVEVKGYESVLTGNQSDGFVLTNTYKPEKPPTPSEKFIEIPVEKIWQDDGHEDKRPTEITVTLYADGVATEKTLVLSAANEWKGVFRHLPEKKDGKSITYTAKEVEVKGYESVLTGNQSDGFVLTNTYKPEKPPTPPTPPKPPIPAIPFVRIPRAGA